MKWKNGDQKKVKWKTYLNGNPSEIVKREREGGKSIQRSVDEI